MEPSAELELLAEPRAPAYIGEVRLNGAAIELDRVLASVSIRHGRDDVDGPIQSSTCTLRLRELPRSELEAWEVGGGLEVADTGLELLFSGRLTDASLTEDVAGAGVLEVIAVSTLAQGGTREVGGHVWPAETWGARMARILTEAGLEGIVQAPAPDVPLAATLPEDPENPTVFASMNALDALELGRADIGATVFDAPDGSIVVQAYDGRGGLYPVLQLDPMIVLYSPAWAQTLDVRNRIVLGYGYGAGSVTVDAPVSQGVYGVSWTGLFDSGLADAATARARALVWLDRVAFPRWKLPGVTLLEPQSLHIGQLVELTELPASAPFGTYAAVIEGWVDTIEGSSWTQDVLLSDSILSGLGLVWADVPAGIIWRTVDPQCAWRDAFLLDNLTV